MAEGAWSMLEGGRNGPVGRVVMSGPGGEYTMSRGVGWLTGPSSSSRSVQVGRWPDGRKSRVDRRGRPSQAERSDPGRAGRLRRAGNLALVSNTPGIN